MEEFPFGEIVSTTEVEYHLGSDNVMHLEASFRDTDMNRKPEVWEFDTIPTLLQVTVKRDKIEYELHGADINQNFQKTQISRQKAAEILRTYFSNRWSYVNIPRSLGEKL